MDTHLSPFHPSPAHRPLHRYDRIRLVVGLAAPLVVLVALAVR